MRYVKTLPEPLGPVQLQEWERIAIDAMEITPFFGIVESETGKIYWLAYMNDNSALHSLSPAFIESMRIEELSQSEIASLINSQSPVYDCTFDSDGRVIVLQIEETELRLHDDPENRPYESWTWNMITRKWQAPVKHPFDHESEIIWSDLQNKWVENPRYKMYSWDEENLVWIYVGEDDESIFDVIR